METPVHIEFQGTEPQEILRAEIARHVAVLEERYGRITACRVVVKDPGQHRRTGGLFEVYIRLALPDRKEVNVGHKPDADKRHADVHSAINDAFKHAQRILRDQVQRMQGPNANADEPRADATAVPLVDTTLD
jgi:hypothetical protein